MAQIRRLGTSSWITVLAMVHQVGDHRRILLPDVIGALLAPPPTWPPPLVVARHGCHVLQRRRVRRRIEHPGQGSLSSNAVVRCIAVLTGTFVTQKKTRVRGTGLSPIPRCRHRGGAGRTGSYPPVNTQEIDGYRPGSTKVHRNTDHETGRAIRPRHHAGHRRMAAPASADDLAHHAGGRGISARWPRLSLRLLRAG
jgi:hypothetical protein